MTKLFEEAESLLVNIFSADTDRIDRIDRIDNLIALKRSLGATIDWWDDATNHLGDRSLAIFAERVARSPSKR
jgi:hypothetical protein